MADLARSGPWLVLRSTSTWYILVPWYQVLVPGTPITIVPGTSTTHVPGIRWTVGQLWPGMFGEFAPIIRSLLVLPEVLEWEYQVLWYCGTVVLGVPNFDPSSTTGA